MNKIVLCLLLVAVAIPGHAALRWHWQDSFSAAEAEMLQAWVNEADVGLRKLFGPLPYAANVHMQRAKRAREPVPWANTWKYREPAVYFHVDPSFGLAALRDDWTASHELSHLLFPYLGESDRWFAEGIASYLQYQIMYASGVIDWPEAVARMTDGFDRGRRDQRAGNLPIPKISQQKKRVRAYRRMYWGGAAYFLAVDQQLAARGGTRLIDVIRAYVACCWTISGANANSMMRRFDRLSDGRIFSQVYEERMLNPGFPDTKFGLRWLANNPPELTQKR